MDEQGDLPVRIVLVAQSNLLLMRLRQSVKREQTIVVGETVRWEEAAQIVEREHPEAILVSADDDAAELVTMIGRRQKIVDNGQTIELTPRQREIIALVVQGLKNREIGERLCLSEHTVAKHLSEIYQRLHVDGRLDLIIFAHLHGIARLE